MHHADDMRSYDFGKIVSRSPAVLNHRFDQEITRHFFKQAPAVSVGLFFIVGGTYYVLQGMIPDAILTTWAAAMLLLSFAVLLCYLAYQRTPDKQNSKFWLRIYIPLSLFLELTLGMLGPMSALLTDDAGRFFILFLLAGSTAGAIATRGVLFSVYFGTASALLLPIAFTHVMMDHPLANVMFVLTLVFYVFMLVVGKNYSESIRSNISLWLNLEQEIETRKQTEELLIQAKHSAEVANKAKNHFLASVSHELRTPLNGIIGFTSALHKSPMEESQEAYVNHIGSCSRSLLHMVNDVLDISTIEAGRMELRHYPVTLSQEMDEVVGLAKRLSEDKGLSFEYRSAPDLPQYLLCDGQRLKQIINNLLSNAIKYTEQGYIRLDISLHSTEGNKANLRFSIEDSGIGIPASEHAAVFDHFTQMNQHAKQAHDGVGLGLSIVSSLIQAMNGKIEFESDVGQGSRFDVYLPLELNTTQHTSEAEPGTVQAAGSAPLNLSQLRVLIVDDNHINRLVLKTFLEPYRIPYHEAASGEEALQQLHDNQFDLVLLDINMPDISGLEVREKYCGANPDGPGFIAVTAHAFRDEIDAILRAGFDECLIKPIAEDDLVGLLKRFASSP